MLVVPERLIAGLMGPDEAFDAVAEVFRQMAGGAARNFPVVREALGGGRQYGFKSGTGPGALGVKAGGYFPGNAARGITNHQSVVTLFDPETGRPEAMIGGNLLTALRTAAAAAVSIDALARPEARVLGILGAGHQAAFQLRAAARVRRFERVIGWNRTPARLAGLAAVAADLGLPFEAVPLERMREAEVIVTVTSSTRWTLGADHVSPGTHLACMGTDTLGKQEVAPALLSRARIFTDEPAQSITLGEAQHAVAEGLLDPARITPLGAVLTGEVPGREDPDQITLYDGTGVGLQDLAVAARVLALAKAQGLAIPVEI